MRQAIHDSALIVHGGAGTIRFEQRHRRGITRALEAGRTALETTGDAIEAVVAAVASMESDPVFNCGYGAVPSLTGVVEMDASLMTAEGRSGAVAAIRDVAHPIVVARLVMARTDHRLLVGEGAIDFARKMNIPLFDPFSPERRRLYRRAMKNLKQRQKTAYFSKLNEFMPEIPPGTVGAVARDRSGMIAAATSTGGILLHLPGRVGDSPIIGAGTYASSLGGASITGHGEAICRELVAYRFVRRLRREPAPEAAHKTIAEMTKAGCSCGLIGIDGRGRIGFAFNTPGMSCGWLLAGGAIEVLEPGNQ